MDTLLAALAIRKLVREPFLIDVLDKLIEGYTHEVRERVFNVAYHIAINGGI